MLSITVIVIIVAAVSGLVNVTTEEQQLLNTMILGADQLSKGITSATWHAMLDDHREAAYQVMQTIALKQGIDRIRMFNRAGQVMFSTNPEDQASASGAAAGSHASRPAFARAHLPRRQRRPPPGHGHAHLQRALVQPGAVPRPSRRDEGARRAGPAPEPGKRGPRSAGHEVPRPAGHRGRSHADQPVHHLLHPPLPQPADRQADRRHQGGEPDGTRQAARHRGQQRGTRRTGALLRRDARPPAHGARRDQPVHPEPGDQGRRAHRSSSRPRRRSCCRATAWPRSDSSPPAWRTKSTIPSPAS